MPEIRLWQHKETGHIKRAIQKPSEDYVKMPIVYEDQLPENITDKQYDWWYKNSYVDFVRIGPKIPDPDFIFECSKCGSNNVYRKFSDMGPMSGCNACGFETLERDGKSTFIRERKK